MRFLFLLFAFCLAFTAQAQVNWTFQNKAFNAGDTVEVKFYVSGFTNINAFQYTLKMDTSALRMRGTTNAHKVSVTGAISTYGINCWSFPGPPSLNKAWEMRTVWAPAYAKTVAPGTHTHTLYFVAKKAGTVCASLWLHNVAPLKCLAWNEQLQQVPQTVTCVEPPPIQQQPLADRNADAAKLYPNPTSDVLFVEADGESTVEVFNTLGQCTHRQTGSGRIEIADLSPGMNWVRINTGGSVTTRAVLRQ